MFWHCSACGLAFPSFRGVSEHILRTDCKTKTGDTSASVPASSAHSGGDAAATAATAAAAAATAAAPPPAAAAPPPAAAGVNEEHRHLKKKMIIIHKQQPRPDRTSMVLTLKKSVSKITGKPPPPPVGNGSDARQENGNRIRFNYGGSGGDRAQVDRSIASVTASSSPRAGGVPYTGRV